MSVGYEVKGPAAWVTIDRPERRNALSPEVFEGLEEGISRAVADDAVRAVVLTGAGDLAFCSGADLEAFAGAAFGGEEPVGGLDRVLAGIQACPKPVVARVNGAALGGGFGLVLGSDLAVAVEDAELGTPEVRLGLWPHVITAVIQRSVPRKVALELMLAGRTFSGAEAARLGIVNRAVPREGLDAALGELVDELATRSPAAVRLGKASFYGAQDMPFAEAQDFLAARLAEHLREPDVAEGIQAFLEKRPPEWSQG